ncbi:hypothetical protein P7C73_g6839, partial [Tremellales sp. Uapishka_1]
MSNIAGPSSSRGASSVDLPLEEISLESSLPPSPKSQSLYPSNGTSSPHPNGTLFATLPGSTIPPDETVQSDDTAHSKGTPTVPAPRPRLPSRKSSSLHLEPLRRSITRSTSPSHGGYNEYYSPSPTKATIPLGRPVLAQEDPIPDPNAPFESIPLSTTPPPPSPTQSLSIFSPTQPKRASWAGPSFRRKSSQTSVPD